MPYKPYKVTNMIYTIFTRLINPYKITKQLIVFASLYLNNDACCDIHDVFYVLKEEHLKKKNKNRGACLNFKDTSSVS